MKFKQTLFFTTLFLLDQVLKHLTVMEKEIITNFLYYYKTTNTGIAFSFFAYKTIFIAIITIILLIFIIRKLKEKKELFKLYSLLFLTGAFSNLLDRLVFSYVIDYIKITVGNYTFPIFNLADVYIVSGIFLLLLKEFGKRRHEKK